MQAKSMAIPEIRGVKFLSDVLFNSGPYNVHVGYIDTDEKKNDIPHYLLVNSRHNVVEGSSAQLFEIRGQCEYMAKQIEQQDEMIAKGESLFDDQNAKGNDGWVM